MGAAGQGGALGDQLGAVVGQRPQVSGLPDGQPHRGQPRFASGDPGSRGAVVVMAGVTDGERRKFQLIESCPQRSAINNV